MPTKSRYLSGTAWRGLERLGDAVLPGDDQFPSFSRLGCAEHVDVLLGEMPADDRQSFITLLKVIRFVPGFLLRGLTRVLERSLNVPGPVGAAMRFLRLGIKGVVLSLYYSGEKGGSYQGQTPLELLDYQVSVYTGDLSNSPLAASGDPNSPTLLNAERS